jgi:hypothetical protein
VTTLSSTTTTLTVTSRTSMIVASTISQPTTPQPRTATSYEMTCDGHLTCRRAPCQDRLGTVMTLSAGDDFGLRGRRVGGAQRQRRSEE